MGQKISEEKINLYKHNLLRLRNKYVEKASHIRRMLAIYNGYGVERELHYNREQLRHANEMVETIDFASRLLSDYENSGDVS